jgi:hypothetical protein
MNLEPWNPLPTITNIYWSQKEKTNIGHRTPNIERWMFDVQSVRFGMFIFKTVSNRSCRFPYSSPVLFLIIHFLRTWANPDR